MFHSRLWNGAKNSFALWFCKAQHCMEIIRRLRLWSFVRRWINFFADNTVFPKQSLNIETTEPHDNLECESRTFVFSRATADTTKFRNNLFSIEIDVPHSIHRAIPWFKRCLFSAKRNFDELTKFTFFHLRQTSRICLLSIAGKLKLNDATC